MNSDFVADTEPFGVFAEWFKAAEAAEPNDPNAMSLATVDGDGMPNVRIVLLKGYDEKGFVFYTNYESAKGRELLATPKAALNFHWKSRRLGEPAVASARIALRPGEGGRGLHGQIRVRRHSAAGLLVGLPSDGA